MKVTSIQVIQIAVLTSSIFFISFVWSKEAQGTNQQVQPLAGLDKMLKQANGVKLDAIVDNKLATNVTSALNDMAQNLGKIFIENRRLNMQVQDLISRVQNATGINAASTLGAIRQQATNMSSIHGLGGNANLSSLMQRLGQ